jgi:hypothetical protein
MNVLLTTMLKENSKNTIGECLKVMIFVFIIFIFLSERLWYYTDYEKFVKESLKWCPLEVHKLKQFLTFWIENKI